MLKPVRQERLTPMRVRQLKVLARLAPADGMDQTRAWLVVLPVVRGTIVHPRPQISNATRENTMARRDVRLKTTVWPVQLGPLPMFPVLLHARHVLKDTIARISPRTREKFVQQDYIALLL